jgi:hypothetical protein
MPGGGGLPGLPGQPPGFQNFMKKK